MNSLYTIFLGIVQGLTEFLPVSSSGHLVIFQHLLGIEETELLFDICLHIGTLIAICIVFAKEIRSITGAIINLPSLTRSAGGFRNVFKENPDIRMAVLIIIGTVPTGIIGSQFHNISDMLFSSVALVGAMLLVTGCLLWATRWVKHKDPGNMQFNIRNALIIGFIQGMAVLPGISRSGSTIAVGLFLGIERRLAARYSFLLSIAAILGAFAKELTNPDITTSLPVGTLILGTAVSAAVGYLALKMLLGLIDKGYIYYFAPYCWILGISLLLWSI